MKCIGLGYSFEWNGCYELKRMGKWIWLILMSYLRNLLEGLRKPLNISARPPYDSNTMVRLSWAVQRILAVTVNGSRPTEILASDKLERGRSVGRPKIKLLRATGSWGLLSWNRREIQRWTFEKITVKPELWRQEYGKKRNYKYITCHHKFFTIIRKFM